MEKKHGHDSLLETKTLFLSLSFSKDTLLLQNSKMNALSTLSL